MRTAWWELRDAEMGRDQGGLEQGLGLGTSGDSTGVLSLLLVLGGTLMKGSLASGSQPCPVRLHLGGG